MWNGGCQIKQQATSTKIAKTVTEEPVTRITCVTAGVEIAVSGQVTLRFLTVDCIMFTG